MLAATAAVLLAAIVAAVSLWRGAARQPWPDLRAYRWFTIAAGLICVSVIVGMAVPTTAGAAPMLSFTARRAWPVSPPPPAGRCPRRSDRAALDWPRRARTWRTAMCWSRRCS